MSQSEEKKFKIFVGQNWKIEEKIRKDILKELDNEFWSTTDVIKHDNPNEGWGEHQYLEKIVHATSAREEDMVSPLDLGDPSNPFVTDVLTRSAPVALRAFVQCIAKNNKDILATMLSDGYFLLISLLLLFYHSLILLLLFLLLLFVFLLDLAKGAWLQMSVQKHWGPGTTEAQNDKHIHVDYGILLIYVL